MEDVEAGDLGAEGLKAPDLGAEGLKAPDLGAKDPEPAGWKHRPRPRQPLNML